MGRAGARADRIVRSGVAPRRRIAGMAMGLALDQRSQHEFRPVAGRQRVRAAVVAWTDGPRPVAARSCLRRYAAAGGLWPRAAPVVLYKGIGLKRARRHGIRQIHKHGGPISPVTRSLRRISGSSPCMGRRNCPNAAQPELETVSNPFLGPAAGVGKRAFAPREPHSLAVFVRDLSSS